MAERAGQRVWSAPRILVLALLLSLPGPATASFWTWLFGGGSPSPAPVPVPELVPQSFPEATPLPAATPEPTQVPLPETTLAPTTAIAAPAIAPAAVPSIPVQIIISNQPLPANGPSVLPATPAPVVILPAIPLAPAPGPAFLLPAPVPSRAPVPAPEPAEAALQAPAAAPAPAPGSVQQETALRVVMQLVGPQIVPFGIDQQAAFIRGLQADFIILHTYDITILSVTLENYFGTGISGRRLLRAEHSARQSQKRALLQSVGASAVDITADLNTGNPATVANVQSILETTLQNGNLLAALQYSGVPVNSIRLLSSTVVVPSFNSYICQLKGIGICIAGYTMPKSQRLSAGAVAGIVLGGLVAAGLLSCTAYLSVKRLQQRQRGREAATAAQVKGKPDDEVSVSEDAADVAPPAWPTFTHARQWAPPLATIFRSNGKEGAKDTSAAAVADLPVTAAHQSLAPAANCADATAKVALDDLDSAVKPAAAAAASDIPRVPTSGGCMARLGAALWGHTSPMPPRPHASRAPPAAEAAADPAAAAGSPGMQEGRVVMLSRSCAADAGVEQHDSFGRQGAESAGDSQVLQSVEWVSGLDAHEHAAGAQGDAGHEGSLPWVMPKLKPIRTKVRSSWRTSRTNQSSARHSKAALQAEPAAGSVLGSATLSPLQQGMLLYHAQAV